MTTPEMLKVTQGMIRAKQAYLDARLPLVGAVCYLGPDERVAFEAWVDMLHGCFGDVLAAVETPEQEQVRIRLGALKQFAFGMEIRPGAPGITVVYAADARRP